MTSRGRNFLFTCALMVLLSACGGGESGSSSGPASTGTPVTIAPTTTDIATPTPTLASPASPAANADAGTSNFVCPAIEPIPADMAIETRYAGASVDPTYATLDAEKVASQAPERARFDRPVTTIVNLSEDYHESSDASMRAAIVACLDRHYAALPASSAMTRADSDSDQYYREWMVSSLGMSWLRVGAPLDAGANAPAVRGWFDSMARAIRQFQDNRTAQRGRLDNHSYWGAAAVAAAGRIAGNADHGLWSRAILLRALTSISADGTLAAEMERGRKATHYHVFGSVPLVATALITRTDIEAQAGGAFRQLAGRLATDIADPQGGLIAARTGTAQDAVYRGQLALLAAALHSDPAVAAQLNRLAAGERMTSYFLGGDLGWLISMAGQPR